METNVDKKPKTKLERGRKKKSIENYLHESEDEILDFTEATSNRNILSNIYFILLFLKLKYNTYCLVSKPTNEYQKIIPKLNNNDRIKTAPDGRLIIVDELSAPPPKIGMLIILFRL